MTVPDDNLPTSSPAPIPLTRGAIERVLARAAELNVGHLDAPEGMTEAELVALGQEVGITAGNVRQALAEERTRVDVPAATGLMGTLFGGTVAMASRIVPGSPSTLLPRIDAWMQREELLRPKRRFAERLTWEARRDLLGSVQVGLNFSGKAYALARATEVGATVIAVDGARSVVRLDASFTDARRSAGIAAAAVTGIGAVGALGVAALVLIPGGLPWLAATLSGAWAASAAGAVYGIARAQRGRLHRLQLGLEQVLDRLEHPESEHRGATITDLLSAITR